MRAPSKKRRDPYQVLGVTKDASPEAIKKAFRRKARESHPDVTGGGTESFVEINHAHALLMDAKRRADYDATGNQEEDSMPVAVAILLQFFEQLLVKMLKSELPPPPIGALLRNDLLEARRQNEAARQDITRGLARAQQLRGKISRPEGENFLDRRVEMACVELEGLLADAERKTREPGRGAGAAAVVPVSGRSAGGVSFSNFQGRVGRRRIYSLGGIRRAIDFFKPNQRSKTMQSKVILGGNYTDKVTGYSGTATVRAEYLAGTPRVRIEQVGEADKDIWFDEARLVPVPPLVPEIESGGAHASASRALQR